MEPSKINTVMWRYSCGKVRNPAISEQSFDFGQVQHPSKINTVIRRLFVLEGEVVGKKVRWFALAGASG
jgi:hypothetical protein